MMRRMELRRATLLYPDGFEWSETGDERTADLTPVDDTLYDLTDDFDAITAGLMGTSVFPGERWGTSVTEWSPTLNAAVPGDATLVRYDLTIAGDDATITLQHAASLRRRAS